MKSLYLKLTILLVITTTSWANSTQKVSIQLDWLHQFQFAGYYIAKEKGFYKQRNLDVTIKEFNFDVDLLKSVINRESTYAVGKSSLILDKINGANIVTLAAIYQHSPMVLLTRKDSLIQSPKELYNKKVMLTPDARMAVAIHSMIVSQGIKLEDVKFEPHSFKLDDLISGKTDAMGCYLSNEPFLLQEKGVEFNILDPRDYGFDFYGGLLFTSQDEVINHPTRTHNFYMATMQGWKYAFENIKETAQLIRNKYNTQNKSLKSLIYEGEVLKKLAEFDKGNLGKITLKKYSEILKIYSLLGFSHNTQALKEFIIEPNSVLLTQKEKTFLKTTPIYFNNANNSLYKLNIQQNHHANTVLSLLENKIPILIKTNNKDIDKNTIQIYDTNNKAHKDMHISNAIIDFDIAIATQKDKGYIGTLSLLNNKKVAIIKNAAFLNQLKKIAPHVQYKTTTTLNEAFKLLNENKVFAVVDLLPTLNYYINAHNYNKIKISGTTKQTYPIQLAIDKENKLLKTVLNKAIDKISIQEKEKIYQSYFKINNTATKDKSLLFKIGIPLILVVILLIVFFSNRRLSKEIKHRVQIEDALATASNFDTLTNIYNRRKTIENLQDNIAISSRYERALSIIFFDVDDFTQINTKYGHLVADNILKELATLVKQNIRSADAFGRWDGEEFIIILPETNEDEAEKSAENLRNLIYHHDFKEVKTFVSCSFGIAQLKEKETMDTLIKKATQAMLSVKKSGKNSVKVG